MDIDFQWSSAADDEQINAIQAGIIEKANALAEKRGLAHPYRYQNYAYISQDVFAGYGAESKARLLKVQEKYDPEHVFVDLQPGYFKLRP